MMTKTKKKSQRRGAKAQLYSGVGAALVSERARFLVLACFVLLVALTGGSSRPDMTSLLLLRPMAVLFCLYALYVATAPQLREVRAPLIVIAALMLLALLQLVPLPASTWSNLPNRELVADASTLLGIEQMARPLSLDPSRTWNTFFALFVPLATVCLVAVQAPRYRSRVIPLLMAVGLVSAALGFLQTISGNSLHFYRISHIGFPVGLFANKNHQSILLLWLMLAGCWFATTVDPHRRFANSAISGALAIILVLFPLLVLTGSRAGLLLCLPALLMSAWLILRAPAMKGVRKKAGRRAKLVISVILAALFVPLLLVFAVLASSDRMTALRRLFEADATADVRWQYLSSIAQMALDFAPFGSGFGTFEKVFNLYEPGELLNSRYMNQAHNDFMQIAIEGGVGALTILIVAFGWFALVLGRVWNASSSGGRNLAVFCGGSMFLWLAASLVDYPLRTPLAAMLIAALTAWLSVLSSQLPAGRAGKTRHAVEKSTES
jgi:hypothetical protein